MDRALAAEQAVLGSLLIGGDWHEARALTADDFTDATHRAIYAAMAGVIEDGDPLDVVTVAERMDQSGTLPEQGMTCLHDLFNDALTTANLGHYAAMVREHAARRRATVYVQSALRELAAGGEPAEVLAAAQAALLGEITTAQALSMEQVLSQAVATAEQARDLAARTGSAGAPTGFPFIDQRTGGFREGRLWVVAGRPGSGKSALALQAAVHAAKRGHPVAMVSLEMSAAESGLRILAQQLQLPATALSNGDSHAVAELLTHPGRHALSSIPMVLDTSAHRLGDLMQRAAEWKRHRGMQVLVVDYLQRLDGGRGSNRNEQLGHVTRALKRLGLDLGVCVVILSALNRGPEREARKPVLADLRESGDIEFDADVVVGLRRVNMDEVSPYEVDVGLLKNRTGHTGWSRDPYRFDGRTQRFLEMAPLGRAG